VTLCNQTFTPELIERIQCFIDSNPNISRTKLSIEVCKWLDWRSPNGKLKDMSCRVALLRLDERGLINLPEAKTKPPKRSGEKYPDVIEELPFLDCNLNELKPIEIIKIESVDKKKSCIWENLMDRYHYLGSGPLCGAQIRYLIHSKQYGYLGGFAFSAAAWRLEARDTWIGWNDSSRRKHLNEIICNSRFLILPEVEVKNLASHVLSLCIKRLPEDWYERYMIDPVVLETFVEQKRFDGTCYRAANWIHVGQTKGRGRQDCSNQYSTSVKDIYVYPLRPDFQEILCDGILRSIPVPVAPVDWAEEEFGMAELGDQRRVNRLLRLARDFYARPVANIPQACGSRAKTKAAYRFFDEKDNTMEKILAPHYQSTTNRISQEKIVLSVQDTTYLNYSTHPATENLGPIGTSVDGFIGLIVHDTMAFNLDGTPLGLLDVQCWARDPEEFGKRHRRHELPIEEKESYKWLKSFQATHEAQKRCPNTVIVSVGDRESDIYELFQMALDDPKGPKLLVRAERDRLLSDGQTHLWDHVADQPVSGVREIQIPKRGKMSARDAKLEVRFANVTLKPPKRKQDLNTLTVWAILAEEVDYPDGVEPLKWILITTVDVDSFEDAVERLDWYTLRYWIEVYHKTLKSGCKIEQRQLGKADRIESCLAIDMVVGWRIFHLTKLGRETPDVPCTVFFEDAEWKALVAYKTQNIVPPEKPPTLRDAMRMVASLGGFLGRKSDGEPGTKTLWLGLQRLDDITEMWKISMTSFPPYLAHAPPCVQ
jgi:hypothetical protein